jgi:hypothetical protein
MGHVNIAAMALLAIGAVGLAAVMSLARALDGFQSPYYTVEEEEEDGS